MTPPASHRLFAAAVLALAALSLAQDDADEAAALEEMGVAPDGGAGSIGGFGGGSGGFALAESLLVPPAAAAPAAPAPLLPPGFALEFPGATAPRSFTLAPAWRSVLVVDGAVHVKARKGALARALAPLGLGWLLTWLLGAQRPVPYAYLVRPHASVVASPSSSPNAGGAGSMAPEMLRRLEFPERRALPYGVAEASDARLGVAFYSAAGVELWSGAELEAKLTLHEHSIKPALPVFDGLGNLWLPFTVADRLDEEGENIIVLWAYDRGGSRFEVFARRQFSEVRFPHSVHLDAEGRVFVAGIAGKWPWVDGQYGQELKPEIAPGQLLARLDVYALASSADLAGAGAAGEGAAAARARAFEREQKFRYCETHGDVCINGEPTDAVPESAWRAEYVRFALAPLRSFAFPQPFATCLWPLFALTGDGHALCSCASPESDTLVVMRLAAPRNGGDEDRDSVGKAGATLGGEAWGPPEPAGGLALLADAEVVLTITQPLGVASIAGLSMDPGGRAFAILDKAGRRVVGAPWPWPQEPPAVRVSAAVPMLPFDA